MASKRKNQMDNVSHKVIEKRRRDRINNCLAELSQTVPAAFAKQTSGKLEKAEILEMTVEYLRFVKHIGDRIEYGGPYNGSDLIQYYQVGYNDCINEVSRYMTDIEGLPINDARCMKTLSYLQRKNNKTFVLDCQSSNSGTLSTLSSSDAGLNCDSCRFA